MSGRAGAYRRFITTAFATNVRAALAYRVSFITAVLFMAANDLMWIAFWGLFFSRFPVIRGWEIRDVITAWAVVAVGFGLATAIFGNCRPEGARLIMEGRLDYHLSLPKSPLLHFLLGSSSVAAWGDVLFGLTTFTAFVRPAPGDFGLFILLGLCACAVFVCCGVLVNSMAFWAGNTESLGMQVMNALITFGTYPLDLFGWGVKLALFTVLPAGFVSYVPVRLLREFDWLLLLALLSFTGLLLAISGAVWRAGLRRYESGSLVTMRG